MSESEKLLPVYSAKEVVDLMKIPGVSTKTLEHYQNAPSPSSRRIVVWHPGASLVDQQHLVGTKLLWIRPHYKKLSWAQTGIVPGYYEVAFPAPETQTLDFGQQMESLRIYGEITCSAVVAAFAWLVHCCKTGESLGFPNVMRCAESSSCAESRVGINANAERIFVGGFCVHDGFTGGANIVSCKDPGAKS